MFLKNLACGEGVQPPPLPTPSIYFVNNLSSLMRRFTSLSHQMLWIPSPFTVQLLQSQDRRIASINGDGNCLFRTLSLIVNGTEMLHAKVRELLVSFVRNNANKFRVYVTEGTLEDHILNMKYTRTWVELYAAASLFQKEIYV